MIKDCDRTRPRSWHKLIGTGERDLLTYLVLTHRHLRARQSVHGAPVSPTPPGGVECLHCASTSRRQPNTPRGAVAAPTLSLAGEISMHLIHSQGLFRPSPDKWGCSSTAQRHLSWAGIDIVSFPCAVVERKVSGGGNHPACEGRLCRQLPLHPGERAVIGEASLKRCTRGL
jgi:hypothetical protein